MATFEFKLVSEVGDGVQDTVTVEGDRIHKNAVADEGIVEILDTDGAAIFIAPISRLVYVRTLGSS